VLAQTAYILTINSGSSSVKFALFSVGQPLARILSGKFDRIGLPEAKLTVSDAANSQQEERVIQAPNHAGCVPLLVELLENKASFASVKAIGHRVVHGGKRYCEPQRVTGEMIAELKRLSPFVPEHLPSGIMLMEALAQRYPHVPQIACFDTAFHRDMPRVAKLLPIPRRYDAKGIQRYGFHGLSYAYLMDKLAEVAGREAAQGRVVLAHLGNGASMAAVYQGKGIDTTMAFTPTAGLVMSRRSGDLDPGLYTYLARIEGMTSEQFHQMVNTQSGLLGVSEISTDVRDLLEREHSDVRAAEAIALFCYQAKKWVGALAAALGGLDTLVFAGGIGENASVIRARICHGLGFIGLELDPARNEANAPVITKDGSQATGRVIRTDEELYIACQVSRVIDETSKCAARQSRNQAQVFKG
jgi:acetate kinase